MPSRPRSCLALGIALLAVGLPPNSAPAADDPVDSLGAPLQIEDAFVPGPGEVELGITAGYERLRSGRGRDSYPASASLQIGLFRNFAIQVEVGETFGNSSDARSGGAVDLNAMYQFNEEQDGLPAFAVIGRVSPHFGPGDEGTETALTLAVSKTTGGRTPFGLHLNAAWLGRIDPAPGERQNRYRLGIALTQAVTFNTAIALTYLREQQEREERDLNLIEAGLRHRLANGSTTVGLAGGIGIGEDSPRFQVVFGIEHTFSLGRR